jgi:4-hydroxy-3-methylbut-2-enyl diphosphate reductase
MKNNIELIDASCPVVLKLQNRLKNSYDKIKTKAGQLVLFGLPGHAEVKGLEGQTNNESILITTDEDLTKIDYTRPISIFSQTTKSTEAYYAMGEKIKQRAEAVGNLEVQFNDTICRQVSNRDIQLQNFATQHSVLLFVSGKKSSNGKVLYNVCKNVNPRTFFISDSSEIDHTLINDDDSVGICGATSTPLWLMQEVADNLQNRN